MPAAAARRRSATPALGRAAGTAPAAGRPKRRRPPLRVDPAAAPAQLGLTRATAPDMPTASRSCRHVAQHRFRPA